MWHLKNWRRDARLLMGCIMGTTAPPTGCVGPVGMGQTKDESYQIDELLDGSLNWGG